jgi:hypothetical protein
MSRSNSTARNDDNGGDENAPPDRLIRKAIRYARATRHHRNMMRTLLRRVDRVADPYLPPDDPAVPPRQFIDELRRPKTAKRRAIRVNVDGKELPVILNPQGVIDVEREVWLWNYIRDAVRDGVW